MYDTFTMNTLGYDDTLAKEATENWGGLESRIKFLQRALKFKRGYGPPLLPRFCHPCHDMTYSEG